MDSDTADFSKPEIALLGSFEQVDHKRFSLKSNRKTWPAMSPKLLILLLVRDELAPPSV